MKERVVTAVRIRHHRIEGKPHFMRLPMAGSALASQSGPIDAPRGVLTALALSGMMWLAVILAIKL